MLGVGILDPNLAERGPGSETKSLDCIAVLEGQSRQKLITRDAHVRILLVNLKFEIQHLHPPPQGHRGEPIGIEIEGKDRGRSGQEDHCVGAERKAGIVHDSFEVTLGLANVVLSRDHPFNGIGDSRIGPDHIHFCDHAGIGLPACPFELGDGRVIGRLANRSLQPGGIEPPISSIHRGKHVNDLELGLCLNALVLVERDSYSLGRDEKAKAIEQRLGNADRWKWRPVILRAGRLSVGHL